MKKGTYTPEEIQKKFDALPADIKSTIYSANMLGLIQKMGEKYKLHIDQLDMLEAETVDVMTGFSKPEDFVANLSISLSIDRVQAENIAKEINDGLFIKIRESLKNMYSANNPHTSQSTTIQTVAKVIAPPLLATQEPVDLHPADAMLSQKTVTTVKPTINNQQQITPPTPKPYTTDPYREPTQ